MEQLAPHPIEHANHCDACKKACKELAQGQREAAGLAERQQFYPASRPDRVCGACGEVEQLGSHVVRRVASGAARLAQLVLFLATSWRAFTPEEQQQAAGSPAMSASEHDERVMHTMSEMHPRRHPRSPHMRGSRQNSLHESPSVACCDDIPQDQSSSSESPQAVHEASPAMSPGMPCVNSAERLNTQSDGTFELARLRMLEESLDPPPRMSRRTPLLTGEIGPPMDVLDARHDNRQDARHMVGPDMRRIPSTDSSHDGDVPNRGATSPRPPMEHENFWRTGTSRSPAMLPRNGSVERLNALNRRSPAMSPGMPRVNSAEQLAGQQLLLGRDTRDLNNLNKQGSGHSMLNMDPRRVADKACPEEEDLSMLDQAEQNAVKSCNALKNSVKNRPPGFKPQPQIL